MEIWKVLVMLKGPHFNWYLLCYLHPLQPLEKLGLEAEADPEANFTASTSLVDSIRHVAICPGYETLRINKDLKNDIDLVHYFQEVLALRSEKWTPENVSKRSEKVSKFCQKYMMEKMQTCRKVYTKNEKVDDENMHIWTTLMTWPMYGCRDDTLVDYSINK